MIVRIMVSLTTAQAAITSAATPSSYQAPDRCWLGAGEHGGGQVGARQVVGAFPAVQPSLGGCRCAAWQPLGTVWESRFRRSAPSQ